MCSISDRINIEDHENAFNTASSCDLRVLLLFSRSGLLVKIKELVFKVGGCGKKEYKKLSSKIHYFGDGCK